jgi:hypothetical protein
MSVRAYKRTYFPIREGKESKSSNKLATGFADRPGSGSKDLPNV